ncbi:hypothetical protein [Acidovorax sp.]|uniref:hypothetical protein n=1 Tax=Acidovorax sp. TaxID=1872122 RepID=UPI003918F09C
MSPSLLTDWLNETVPLFPPPGVVAWNFNIAETGSDYVIELIGASGYDAQDPDWACPPEAWTSRPYQLAIPYSTFDSNWERALFEIVASVRAFLASSDSSAANILRQSKAVCASFVDGDLVQVWPDAKA